MGAHGKTSAPAAPDPPRATGPGPPVLLERDAAYRSVIASSPRYAACSAPSCASSKNKKADERLAPEPTTRSAFVFGYRPKPNSSPMIKCCAEANWRSSSPSTRKRSRAGRPAQAYRAFGRPVANGATGGATSDRGSPRQAPPATTRPARHHLPRVAELSISASPGASSHSRIGLCTQMTSAFPLR
jgi:hypothetical protein